MEIKRKRSITFSVRLSADEAKIFNEKIVSSGLSKTDFIVKSVFDTEINVHEELKETLTELKRQGVNLNQALKIAGQQKKENADEIQAAIKNCNECYQKLFKAWEKSQKKKKSQKVTSPNSENPTD